MQFSHTALFIFFATIVFLLGWLGLLPFEVKNLRTRKWLLTHGKPVVATITSIQQQTKGHRSKPCWIILARWIDPVGGSEYRFQSDALAFDPGLQLESGVVTVLIDPANPRRYYLDTSPLSGAGEK